MESDFYSKMSQATEDRPQPQPTGQRPDQQQVRNQQHVPSRPSHHPPQHDLSQQQLHTHLRPPHHRTMQRLKTKFPENQVSQSHMRPRQLPNQHPSWYHQHPRNHDQRTRSGDQTTAPVHTAPSSYERQHTVIRTNVTVSNNHTENSSNDAPPDYNMIVFPQSPPPYGNIV